MSRLGVRDAAKQALGGLPMSAELYQRLLAGQTPPPLGYRAERLEAALPRWVRAIKDSGQNGDAERPKRVLVIGYLRYWIEFGCALGLLLVKMGHHVELGILPYRHWTERVPTFDVRRQRAYLRSLLSGLRGLIPVHDLSRLRWASLPPELARSVEKLSRMDTQYTLLREELDLEADGLEGDLYRLRQERNSQAAGALMGLIARNNYDIVIVPNGSVLEFGAAYRTAQFLDVPVTTFEFIGEQHNRIFLAQNDEVVRFDTTALWEARGKKALTESELEALKGLYSARRGGELWQHFQRRWQAGKSKGAEAARAALGLDPERPVVLLCTNVVGDSMALDRQVFSQGMVDWLVTSVRHISSRPDAQLVVRVHPGEALGTDQPSDEIVRSALPELPANISLVEPESKINTYDLIELAHLGLVYTTTVGMEMAMNGVPVVAAGQTHYLGKGFTESPQTLEEYLAAIERRLGEPLGRRLSDEQVELAWRYAYRFFFEYPFPFPWHIRTFWDDEKELPFEQMIQPEMIAQYQPTLHALLGEQITWDHHWRQKAEV